ncbi:hypothetical protein HYX08_01130 [Candidatus Woesearchaeota archaeon]|nr:hypothetical protein [Candidatus Woesearchaeota archaeon]
MNSTKIVTFDYLTQFSRIHVRITDGFFSKLKNEIVNKYGIKKFSTDVLGMNYRTFYSEFAENIYHPFYRILKIIEILNISKEELYSNILGFYHWGSHDKSYLVIPREFPIDEFFVEGYALYFAEGDNGSNGKTRPRKFRFTNSEPSVINHMVKWINTYFPCIDFYVNLVNPKGNYIDFESAKLSILYPDVRFREESYNKVIKYKLCLDNAVIIDLVLALEDTIKGLCSKNAKLAASYIRGMMIGEGTAYFNKSRYVRIEMRNEKEIKYLHQLLTMLGFDCKPVLRLDREDHWSIYIGAKQLDKFAREIGFGVHKGRQRILDKGVAKILRVNQHC